MITAADATTQAREQLRHGAIDACLTLAWRALLRIKHQPFQLFDVTMTPIMFTLLMTYIYGGALAGSPQEYLQFLLPGIFVQTLMFLTIYTSVGLNTDLTRGLFERFRSMPIWQPAPLIGALLGDLFRYAIAATVMVGLGLILGFRPGGGVIGVLLAFALVSTFCMAISWAWMPFAMRLGSPESVMAMGFTFIFPLTFVSSAFVDPKTMPGWLQAVVAYNPVTICVSGARALMHGQPAADHVVMTLSIGAGVVAVFGPLVLMLYRRELPTKRG
jgi:ABC-2 type transport system permease protein